MGNLKINVGTDIVEVKRFRRKPLRGNLSFYNSVFTKSELEYCLRYSDPYPHLAGIFAAKEAAIKCSTWPLRMIDINVVRDADGRPSVVVRCNRNTMTIKVSISHTRSLAIAVAIITM